MHPLKTMVLLLMFCCPRLLSMSVMPSKTYKVFTLVKNLIAKMLHFRQITFQPAHNIPGIFGKCSLSQCNVREIQETFIEHFEGKDFLKFLMEQLFLC